MESKDKEEILVAIARLEEKNEHLEGYIYKELKPDIEKLCNKVENCMKKADECHHKNFKWMITAMITTVIAISCVIGLIMTVVV